MARRPEPVRSRPASTGRTVRSLGDLQALPKAELHLHLRGAAPRAYLRDRLRKQSPASALEGAPRRQLSVIVRHPGVRRILKADDPAAELDRLFEYRTFVEFLGAYLFTAYLVRDIEDFLELVRGVRQGLAEQRITYAEITVSIPEYLQQGLALKDILSVLAADPSGVPVVRWIIDPVRSLGPEAAARLLEDIARQRPATVVGMTLGGAEHLFPPELFTRVYEIARETGIRTTVHAGEALGAESVWHAVRTLRVERIGHGVRSIEDPSLVRHLAERRIPLEVCPTSNVRTGVYQSLEEHPVRELFEAGVPMSINTDDPTFFGVSLAEELAGLRSLGFSWSEIDRLARGARAFAFGPVPAV